MAIEWRMDNKANEMALERWAYCPFLLTCAFILRASGTYAEDHSADLLLLEGIVQNKLDQLYCSGASVEGRRKLGNEGTQAANRHCKAAQQHKTSLKGRKQSNLCWNLLEDLKRALHQGLVVGTLKICCLPTEANGNTALTLTGCRSAVKPPV